MNEDLFKLDKNSFSIISLMENENDVRYWLSKTPEERILAIEFLRQLIFGYDPSTERLQRVFETAEFKTS
ncbi:MAG TPA: hypothetical protein VK870_11225 [Ignavibacteriaceae bacterium]|jgi:hypothetical protein|nr:hypothetical protein [Ignavibacteriaceae bacterium]